MLTKLLTPDVIHIYHDDFDWRTAVKKGCEPLIRNGAINASYVDAIYRSHEAIGPYYVLGPGIAMPHSRPEDGVNRIALSLTVFKQGVSFGSEENDPVHLLVTLAAVDSNSHVDTIAQLAELFMNDEDVRKICGADSVTDITTVLEKYRKL
ncbi:PTS sugar transporter subunit IIA [Vibrio salinus]|uniref:PTS sugar transporter subunit IIA n=1 Tax=Vibrio salinus TaxID=2899784 RepID=UPI001E324FC2|nr:PTS sugar transporter subunit IIA [Vibrio salinus]MCE0494488.1 PTS sugar transporter subunit IIA [Vibrio salinus]